jgi:hypothetical protein
MRTFRDMSIALTIVVTILGATTRAWAGTWLIQTTKNPSSTVNVLNGVTALSSSNAWAVGYFVNANGVERTLIEHYDGTTWTKDPNLNQNNQNNVLTSTRGTSSTNLWAVGRYEHLGTIHPFVVHNNGSGWFIHPPIDMSAVGFTGVATSGSSNVWAVGSNVNHQYEGLAAEHYDGTGWTVVPPAPATGFFNGVTTINSSHVWAVGGMWCDVGCWNETLIEFYNGSSWIIQTSPNPGYDQELQGVSANGESDVWAVGGYVPTIGSNNQSLILHYDGLSWAQVSSPHMGVADQLQSVKAVSPTDVWAVGYSLDDAGVASTLILHYDGTTWSVQSSPNRGIGTWLFGVASQGSANSFAVGEFTNAEGVTKTLALHCAC